jgi:hypothetical protein
MPADRPLAYFVLGAAGSGRREVLADLIEGGLGEGERAAVLLAADEAPDPADARLGSAGRWRPAGERAIEAEVPPEATHVFIVADGRRNPVDQIEGFRDWLAAADAELGRILCVVDCRLAERHPPLAAWFEACIHFSDVVLFNHRHGVANKWMSDFRTRFEKHFYPCLFEFVKEGRVANPALILDPQARRMSHAFDAEPYWSAGEAEEAADDDGEDGDEAAAEEDPYLAQHAGGRRVVPLPDIAAYLT